MIGHTTHTDKKGQASSYGVEQHSQDADDPTAELTLDDISQVFAASADIGCNSPYPIQAQLDRRCTSAAVDDDGFFDLGVLCGQGTGENDWVSDSARAYGERDGGEGSRAPMSHGALSEPNGSRAASGPSVALPNQEGGAVGTEGDGFVDLGMLSLAPSGVEPHQACPTTKAAEEGEANEGGPGGGVSCGRRGSEAMKTEVRGRLQALMANLGQSPRPLPLPPQQHSASQSLAEAGLRAAKAAPRPSSEGAAAAPAQGWRASSFTATCPESSTSDANGEEQTPSISSTAACPVPKAHGFPEEDVVAFPPGMDGLMGNPDGDTLCPVSFEASADKTVELILAQQEGGPTRNARLNEELVNALREHLKMYRSPASIPTSNTQ